METEEFTIEQEEQLDRVYTATAELCQKLLGCNAADASIYGPIAEAVADTLVSMGYRVYFPYKDETGTVFYAMQKMVSKGAVIQVLDETISKNGHSYTLAAAKEQVDEEFGDQELISVPETVDLLRKIGANMKNTVMEAVIAKIQRLPDGTGV